MNNVEIISEFSDYISDITVYRSEEGFSIQMNSEVNFDQGESITIDLTHRQFSKFIVDCIKHIKS